MPPVCGKLLDRGLLVPLGASMQEWKGAFSRLWDDPHAYRTANSNGRETFQEYRDPVLAIAASCRKNRKHNYYYTIA